MVPTYTIEYVQPDSKKKLVRTFRVGRTELTKFEFTGIPVSVQIPSGHEKALLLNNPLTLVEGLNKLGGQHGVGRIDIVENRFLGLKVIITL